MSENLIPQKRAKYNINQTVYTTAEDETIDALIGACSVAFAKYLNRELQASGYDELLSGNLEPNLPLTGFPILSVNRVAQGLSDAIEIKNTSWPTNTRATVAVTSTGLKLLRVASGVTTPDVTVTWLLNPTLNAVVTAVNALGSGWSASLLLDSNYGTWAAEDIRPIQGALNVANSKQATLKIFMEEFDDYEVFEKEGILYRSSGWPRGRNNLWCVYAAGYEEIPEDVQEACAIMVAGAFRQTKRDPMSMSTKTADFTYNAQAMFMLPWPSNVLRILGAYRRIGI